MRSSRIPDVYIIILNWNGRDDTLACIRSLQRLTYRNYTIVVVDNGSEDDSAQQIRAAFPDVKLIENNENKGYAAGNNVGIRFAMNRGADYVWLLNNDTEAEPDALTPLVEKMENNKRLGLCGSKIVYYDERDTIQVLSGGSYNKWTGIPTNFGQHRSVDEDFDQGTIEENLDFVLGASMFASAAFIREVGLLAEEYFLYYEEIDWGIRAKDKFELGFEPKSVIYHKEGASTKATVRDVNNKSRLSDYYHIKNRLKLTCKFHPWLLPVVYLFTLGSIMNRVKRRQWDRIPMILTLLFTFNNTERYKEYAGDT